MSTPFADLDKPVMPAIVELFILDATFTGQGVFYFCAATNELGLPVIYNSNTFAALPIQGSGWAKTTGDSAPRPRITIDNTHAIVQSVLAAAGDLSGCLFTRIRISANYLDAVNFASGVNPTADPGAYLSRDTYVIDRLVSMDKTLAQFELCWMLDRPGIRLPRRIALRDFGFPGLGLNTA